MREINECFLSYSVYCREQKSPLIFIILLITSFCFFFMPCSTLSLSHCAFFNHPVITQPAKHSSFASVHLHHSVIPQFCQVFFSLLIATFVHVCVLLISFFACRDKLIYELSLNKNKTYFLSLLCMRFDH